MAGDKSDPVDKVKAGIKGLFSRKKKSKADEPSPTATAEDPNPGPSSITHTEAPSLPPISGVGSIETSETLSDPLPSTKEPAATEPSRADVPKPIPKITPAEGMSATSGPLDDFETMQSHDRERPSEEPPVTDNPSPEAPKASEVPKPDDDNTASTPGHTEHEGAEGEPATQITGAAVKEAPPNDPTEAPLDDVDETSPDHSEDTGEHDGTPQAHGES